MKINQLKPEQKAFAEDVVFRTLDNRSGKAHTKANLAAAVNAAMRNKFGFYPAITTGTIDTILASLKRAGKMLAVGTADGKGLVAVMSDGNNRTPRVFDAANTVALRQRQAAGTIDKQIGNLTLQITLNMLPASGMAPAKADATVRQIEAGNSAVVDSAKRAQDASRVRYAMIPIDENGKLLLPEGAEK